MVKNFLNVKNELQKMLKLVNDQKQNKRDKSTVML